MAVMIRLVMIPITVAADNPGLTTGSSATASTGSTVGSMVSRVVSLVRRTGRVTSP